MVLTCCTLGCKEKSTKDRLVSFHCFPKEEERRKLWLSKLKLKSLKISHNTKICSKHFTPGSFDREKFGGTWLKKTAIPTLFLLPNHSPPVKKNYSQPKERNLPRTINTEDLKVPDLSEHSQLSKKHQYFIGNFQEVDMTSPITKAFHVLNAINTCNKNDRENIKDFRSCSEQEILEEMKSKTLVVQPANDILEVCELHFEPSQILREASAYDPRTGRTLTAPLAFPRLRKGAIPTIFMPATRTIAKSKSHPNGVACRRKKKAQTKDEKMKETKKKDCTELAKLLKTDPGSESETVTESPVVIKQEPDDPVNEPNPLVIRNVFCAENLASSSSSPPFINSPPFSKDSLSDPDSTNIDETGTTHKPEQKSKTNDRKPKTKNTSPSTHRSKLVGRPKRSSPLKRTSALHPNASTPKKSAKFTVLQNKDVEEATREMFQHLVNDSEDNPFGSRTGEKHGDLFNVFGNFIADKLRDMSFDNCSFALRAILEIVFKASRVQPDSEEDGDISDSSTASPTQE